MKYSMFKGLRTKIESEQKGQSPIRQNKPVPVIARDNDSHLKEQDSNNPATNNPVHKFSNEIDLRNKSSISAVDSQPLENRGLTLEKEPPISEHVEPNQYHSLEPEDSARDVNELKLEIQRLEDQLKYVIKERDESNDQNTQLYQLVEKLRRNLENEKETNSSLQNRLNQLETALNEREDSKGQRGVANKNISIKSFESNDATNKEAENLDNLINLRVRINELQSQLSEKTRQLKIRQQNMNDIKKALQREIQDHSRTQDELNKLQKQMQGHCEVDCGETLQNVSVISDRDAVSRTNHSFHGDKTQETKDACEETVGGANLESMSNLSSNASVDDFDSNDLQQNNKEVNHEYLRNVLFRYMTSTESETTQHLVKAITVLMNFTPEQSAAVKCAMNSRTSWLRLKK